MTKVSNKNYIKFSITNSLVNLSPRNGSTMHEDFFPRRNFWTKGHFRTEEKKKVKTKKLRKKILIKKKKIPIKG